MNIIDKFSSFFDKKIDEDNNVSFNGISDKNKWKAYFYPSTYDDDRGMGVLKNLKGIRDNEKLDRFEKYRTITNAIKIKDVDKTFDVKHYKAIHKTIFNGVYSWAGEFRQVNMGKGNSKFCDYEEIPEKLNSLFSDVNKIFNAKENKDRFTDELCKFYLKLNDIHAFREGNGRTQNQFISQICEKCGYSLNLQSIMDNLKQEKINYYNFFSDYNRTGNHETIRKFLFERNLTKNIEEKQGYSQLFKKQFDKASEELKTKAESIKQQNYAVRRIR